VTAPFIDKWWNDRQSPVAMRAKYVKETVKQRLADKPGHSLFYSNSSYLMAGTMLEKIMVEPFEQLMTEEMFNPIGLHTAGFGPPVKFDSKNQPVGQSGVSRAVHPGGNAGFLAQVVVDPERKNAVLLTTNVRASHNHLFKATNRIKSHYSPVADLPGIE